MGGAQDGSSGTGTGCGGVSDKVARMRAVVNGRAMSAWDELWVQEVTPWDLHDVTPVVARLVWQQQQQQQGEAGVVVPDPDPVPAQQQLQLPGVPPELPGGRALVPGCGAGYDAVALAGPGRAVVGLDISETAVARARARAADCGDPNARYVQFVAHDFFTYSPPAPFDLFFDYTFFVALDPSLRPAWGKRVGELLARHSAALLVTLMYPVGEFQGGPPYAVSVAAYEQVLRPEGLRMVYCHPVPDALSVEGRRGRELLAFWRRSHQTAAHGDGDGQSALGGNTNTSSL